MADNTWLNTTIGPYAVAAQRKGVSKGAGKLRLKTTHRRRVTFLPLRWRRATRAAMQAESYDNTKWRPALRPARRKPLRSQRVDRLQDRPGPCSQGCAKTAPGYHPSSPTTGSRVPNELSKAGTLIIDFTPYLPKPA